MGGYRPCGQKVRLPHGGLPEVISSYMLALIKKTGGQDGPLGKQFIAQPNLERRRYKKGVKDPLMEDKFEVAPGLVYKYRGKINQKGDVVRYGRALWTVSMSCATYCRFCTRGREVGLPFKNGTPFLTDQEIKKSLAFLKAHRELNEVILSGGDPLVMPKSYLEKVINGLVKLQKSGHLSIIRIGTRAPITNPGIFKTWHYDLVKKIKKPYLMVHINHPEELTEKVLEVLDTFREVSCCTVMSQTVLLKGVNDSPKILYKLFSKMAENGIRPYYLFQNDPVYWARHHTVPIKRAIKLWQTLRPKLSGVAATVRFAIDVPFGFGKIPLPEGNAWRVDYSSFKDFKGVKHLIKTRTVSAY